MTGKFKDISYTADRKPIISFVVDEISGETLDEWSEKELNIDVKVKRKKRSLDANAYAWVLLDKLSEVTRVPKTELYKHYIQEIGGTSTVICVQEQNADKISDDWKRNGIGWIVQKDESKIDGCVLLILYEGSSVFDTEQMSRLIELIQDDCEDWGIDTRTPDEIKNMLSLWSDKI